MDRQLLLKDLERFDFFKYVKPQNLDTVKNGLLSNVIDKQAFFFPMVKTIKISMDAFLALMLKI